MTKTIHKYKIGITSYDDFNMLYETKVGLNDKKQTLLYSVWGKSQDESLNNTKKLVEILVITKN